MSIKALTFLLLTGLTGLAGLTGTAQKVTIWQKGLSIAGVLRSIGDQTGYQVIYSHSDLEDAPHVNLHCRNMDFRQVLDSCLAGLQLSYIFIDSSKLCIYRKAQPKIPLYVPLQGRVLNTDGEALEGATVGAQGIPEQATRADGSFLLPVKSLQSSVTVSHIGYSRLTLNLRNDHSQEIHLRPAAGILDQVVVQAYGRTTTRLATGSIVQVDGAEMTRQPAGNVLEALEGRVPGMTIQQINGVPGSAYHMLIRGRQSISQGTDPLIVIDDIPVQFNRGLLGIIGSGSAQGPSGASELNGIPMSAVASIQVLKGAAATAIYGSRGSNGAILLTLKTGAISRRLKWNADVYTGIDQVVRTSPLMNTSQYLAMRRQAVTNDTLQVNAFTVPEMYLWDSTRYTDFKKFTIGNTRVRQHQEFGVSGGNTSTTFYVSGSHHGELAVFPGASSDDRWSAYGQVHHQSANKRLSVGLSALYSQENTRLPIQDFTYFGTLAPNAPPFVSPTGQPQWSVNGISYLNIPAVESNTYRATVINQFYHLQLAYEALPGLKLKANLGYYKIGSVEQSNEPASAQDPASDPASVTYRTGNRSHSQVMEGIAEYSRRAGPGRLDALVGLNWQGQSTTYSAINAADQLLSGTYADSVNITNNSLIYKYEAVFGRLNYIMHNRYIATLSGRRDGSSRFGPGNQWGNFWALGGAWIISEEPFVQQLHWLSFAKLRGSLGTTGNDQIGANGYTQIYSTSTTRGYQGVEGILPSTFSNAGLRWEVNYSSELAVDLGFLQNKVLLSATAYRDWTTNQLLYISLAAQTGLPGASENVPASVVNEGLELSLQTHNLTTQHFSWVSTISMTAPVNRLKRFPDLGNSGFANSLVAGKSLSVIKGYHYEGVNDTSGLYQFKHFDQNTNLDNEDVITGGNLDVHAYGGCDQRFRYRNWELDLFFEFRLQSGYNPYVVLYQENPPGFAGPSMQGNASVEWQYRWQNRGDHAALQKVTESYTSAAFTAMTDYMSSDAQSVNASFLRWKSAMISYQLKGKPLRWAGMRECRFYAKGQNLWTKTRFPVTDPETQNPTVLPPMRTVVAGVRLAW
jgi:TonB-dependent starch-binding outer membrane protein SusC